MISTVKVRFGKPVVHLPFRMLRTISYVALILNMISIVYICEMLSVSTHVHRYLGQYVDLLKENGQVLSSIVISAGLLILPSNISNIYSLVKVFRTSHKWFNALLFVNVVVSLVVTFLMFILIILALTIGVDTQPGGLQGLLEAMASYSEDGLIKSKIDRMQIEFQCCGARNYSDWYDIEWYDKNFVRKGELTVVGQAPFSCCSIRSTFPCIHHGIETGAGAYIYTPDKNFSLSVTGCFESIQDKKMSAGWQICRYIFCLMIIQITGAIPLRIIQTAHLERGKFDKEGYLYTAWLLGCYAGKKRKVPEPPPVPPLPPELLAIESN